MPGIPLAHRTPAVVVVVVVVIEVIVVIVVIVVILVRRFGRVSDIVQVGGCVFATGCVCARTREGRFHSHTG